MKKMLDETFFFDGRLLYKSKSRTCITKEEWRRNVMREKGLSSKIAKVLKVGCSAVLLFLVIPYFFNIHPGYRFFWNVLVLFVLCLMIINRITKGKEMSAEVTVGLVISVIMANGWYDYQNLTLAFPYLKNVSQTVMLIIGGVLILVSILFASIFNVYKSIVKDFERFDHESADHLGNPQGSVNRNRNNPRRLDDEDLERSRRTAGGYPGNRQDPMDRYFSESENGSGNGRDTRSRGQERPINTRQREYFRPKLKTIIGSIFAISAILVLGGIVAFIAVQNQEVLVKYNNQELLNILFGYLGFWCICIFAICCMIIIVQAFIKAFLHFLHYSIQDNGKIIFGNDQIISGISFILVIFIFVIFRESTMEDLYESLNGSSEMTALLVGIVMVILLTVAYQVIYKILSSCIYKNGLLHTYSSRITYNLVSTICKLIDNVVKSLKDVPSLYDSLFEAFKKACSSTWDLLFHDEEETE